MKLAWVFPLFLIALISHGFAQDEFAVTDHSSSTGFESTSTDNSASTFSSPSTETQSTGTTNDFSTSSDFTPGSSSESTSSNSNIPSEPSTNGVTTNGPGIATTLPATTEAVLTTQEDIWGEFDVDCNSTLGYCVYKISGPNVDPSTYKTDSDDYKKDNEQYLSASAAAYAVQKDFQTNNILVNITDVETRFDDLKSKWEELASAVNEAYESAQNQTEELRQAREIVKKMYSDINNCYYSKCGIPTQPPVVVTTTIKPTPPDACAGYECAYNSTLNGACVVWNGKPACTCFGNLDASDHCKKAGCPDSATDYPPGMLPGPFWSVGYSGGSTGISYPPNQTCKYRFNSNKTGSEPLTVNVKHFIMDTNSKLIVQGKIISPFWDEATVKSKIDAAILKSKTISITFTSGTTVPTDATYYFDLEFS